jgi:hypothetical protein
MKLQLDNQQLAEEFFEDTRLLGIMAPIKDYQLCWYINNLLGTDFRINHEIEIQLTRKKRNYFFGVYEFSEPTRACSHYIYNNQFDGEYLLSEFRHLDFLWLIKGDIVEENELQQKADLLRNIKTVQLVIELAHEKIKHKENMVF